MAITVPGGEAISCVSRTHEAGSQMLTATRMWNVGDDIDRFAVSKAPPIARKGAKKATAGYQQWPSRARLESGRGMSLAACKPCHALGAVVARRLGYRCLHACTMRGPLVCGIGRGSARG